MRKASQRKPSPQLKVEIAGIKLANPVLIASGIFGYGEGYPALADLKKLGGVILKSITLRPRQGNPGSARAVETPAGMINSIGLENVGLERLIAEKLPFIRRYASVIIVSLAGETEGEFVEMASRLDAVAGIAALELNISCPNVERGGMEFGVDTEAAGSLVKAVRAATQLPIIAKLTPNVTDLAAIARSCEEAGADALSLINTFSAMSIDIRTRRPRLGGNFGGLSGPAIRPAAVLRVYQVAKAAEIPVIGMGGIWDAQDAIEFMVAGATAVAVGTAVFYDPGRPLAIVDGIRSFLQEQKILDVRKLIGSVELNQ